MCTCDLQLILQNFIVDIFSTPQFYSSIKDVLQTALRRLLSIRAWKYKELLADRKQTIQLFPPSKNEQNKQTEKRINNCQGLSCRRKFSGH